MEHKRWRLFFAAVAMICGVICANQALAESVTLFDTGLADPNGAGGDQTKSFVFPSQVGQTTNSSCIGSDICPVGEAGIPDVMTITVEWDNNTGQLLKITLTSPVKFPTGGDSLFINTNYTGDINNLENWDYYVKSGTSFAGAGYPSNGLYQVVDDNGHWANFAAGEGYTHTPAGALGQGNDGRTNHANGIDPKYLARRADVGPNGVPAAPGNVGVARNNSGLGPYTLIYDFSQLNVNLDLGPDGILLGEQFVIGYTPWCANDVVLVVGSRDSGSGAVPEPATIVLFGLGSAGLAGWRARRSVAKK